MNDSFVPRPAQRAVLAYRRGKMGVAAVPGAGKTRTLSALAARIIASDALTEGQEVLIVTLVNAAVNNFEQQIARAVRRSGLFNVGYRVRTLHGICSEIVRERPALVGLGEAFTILDEREANRALDQAAVAWLDSHPGGLDSLLDPDLSEPQRQKLYRDGKLQELIVTLGRDFIRQAKDLRVSPTEIAEALAARPADDLPLVALCLPIYESYQRALTLAGAVDFQDLIRLALTALERDPRYLARLQRRWPFILEDEAQDSSRVQESLLRLLVGRDGNWVRVGDPNQAIYETFTAARPDFLRHFLREPGVQPVDLPDSGRCAPKIIDLANFLITWSQTDHPVPEVRERQPLQPPFIRPAPPGDPQPNPPDAEASITLYPERLTPDEELTLVARSARQWIENNPGLTVAALAATNHHAAGLADALRREGVPFIERLRSSTGTRLTAGALSHLMVYLSRTDYPPALARAYEVWRRIDRLDEESAARLRQVSAALRTLSYTETFTHPGIGGDWLATPAARALIEADPLAGEHLMQFRDLVRRWQAAIVLPVDQLLLVLAQDTFTDPADLAIAHSMAVALRGVADLHPEYRLPQFTEELEAIAQNARKFLSIDDSGGGFDPGQYPGKVIVMTLHAAKGLEFDRVYLMACNTYDFPSGVPGDQYMSEKWYARNRLNLNAEVLAQLDAALDPSVLYSEGEATRKARIDYAGERLRLLYVGITRAKRDLIMTWNAGRRGDVPAALPFLALRTHLPHGADT